MDDKIIAKISKLLAKGNGSSFEGEADTFLNKAYTLMQEHNISMAQIESANRDDELGTMGEHFLIRFPNKSWEQILLYNIAKLFDCSTFINHSYIGHGQKQKSFYIVGREGNRITTELMYKWIRDKIDGDSYRQSTSASGRNSYSLGCAFAIQRKVEEMKKETPETDAWGIVPLNEVDDWLSIHHPNLRAGHSHVSIGDARAYMQGSSDGANISLNRQFGQHAITDGR